MVSGQPYVILSDGADSQINQDFSEEFKNLGKQLKLSNGVILNYLQPELINYWIENIQPPVFAFGSKPFQLDIDIGATGNRSDDTRVQIQIFNGEKLLKSSTEKIAKDEVTSRFTMTIPALKRGQYQLEVKLAPVAGEKEVWDNSVFQAIEVLPDTVPILHLLGEPSWDGRYLRRYLKSEPKFDMISFFILRDLYSRNDFDSREMSLIQFPTNRLFEQELSSFKLVIFQNFNLSQFLQPKHQKNLVDFVKNGGGLLFIGGRRSLLSEDVWNSPLKEILPFQPPKILSGRKGSPKYDANQQFKVRLAEPSQNQRNLADVYDDLKQSEYVFDDSTDFYGLHKSTWLERMDSSQVTPLLEAELADGSTQPLVFASYPGEGRAIWAMTDSLWQLNETKNVDVSRGQYNKMMQEWIRWLLRSELKKPLRISSTSLKMSDSGDTSWALTLVGNALKNINKFDRFDLKICNQVINLSTIKPNKIDQTQWQYQGEVNLSGKQSSEVCLVELFVEHASLGAFNTTSYATVPKILKDSELYAGEHKLRSISTALKIDLFRAGSKHTSGSFEKWLDQTFENTQSLSNKQLKNTQDHFWLFGHAWSFLLLLFLPFEIYVRRVS